MWIRGEFNHQQYKAMACRGDRTRSPVCVMPAALGSSPEPISEPDSELMLW